MFDDRRLAAETMYYICEGLLLMYIICNDYGLVSGLLEIVLCG